MSDGSLMYTYNKGNAPVFAIDINGLKGPNKGGFDLFSFMMTNKGESIIWGEGCIPKASGGKTMAQMLRN